MDEIREHRESAILRKKALVCMNDDDDDDSTNSFFIFKVYLCLVLCNVSVSCIQLKALQDEEEAARERASRFQDDRKAHLGSISYCRNPYYEVL